MFTFEVRVTGIWNLTKAYRYSVPSFQRESSFTFLYRVWCAGWKATRNQRGHALNKSREKLRSFSKIYYIYFWRCVARQIIYLPSCVARQMAMICFEKSNIHSASETNQCSCNGGHFIESFDYKGLQPLGGTQFLLAQGQFLLTAAVRFRFTGTNSARQPTLFAFLILLERCAHMYARAGKSSLFKRFLGSLPITTESIMRFLIKGMLFSKI